MNGGNFKVKCIKDCYGFVTKDKVYEFVNGITRWDDGTTSSKYRSFSNFKEQNNDVIAPCVVELKEENTYNFEGGTNIALFNRLMRMSTVVADAIKDVKELDEALESLNSIANDRDIISDNSYVKNECHYDDNLVAIDLLKDVTKIIEGIEHDDVRSIRDALLSLKNHTTEFDEVFTNFVENGLYR